MVLGVMKMRENVSPAFKGVKTEKRRFLDPAFCDIKSQSHQTIEPKLANFRLFNEKEEKLARALSAQPRRDILRLLGKKQLTVSKIAEDTSISLSLASRHLTLLADLGLILKEKNHPHTFYSLRSKTISELLADYETIHHHHSLKMLKRGEENLARILNAGQRRMALRLLADNELTVSELASRTKMSISLASRHLKLAHDLGFLQVRKAAPQKYYSLAIVHLKQLIINYDAVLKEL